MSDNKNIVVFGPTNSGKSTLLGYLEAKSMHPDIYRKKIDKFKAKLGRNFSEEEQLSYFFDTASDELRSRVGKNPSRINPPGNTMRKKFHALTVGDMEFTAIDTPGTTNRWKNGYQGILMGDIGIFVIEIRLVMELCSLPSQASSTQKRLRELFAPANLWIQCKSASRLVIVLSKTDDKRISNFSILCAKQFLHDMKDFEKIPVIATGINVPMCQGINILDSDLKRDGMQNEESLLEALRHIQEKLVQTNDLGDQSIASIDRIFKHTNQLKAPAIRIKVQSGNLKIKDTVALGPVLYRDKIVTLKGKIISLMDEGSHKRVPVLMKNGIGGIVFSKLQYNKEIISLKDVSLLGTTLLWKKPINMRYENVLTFSVPESTAAQTLAARQVISLIFFGKKIPLKILSCSFQKSNYRIRLMNPHPTDLLPFPLLLRPDGTFCYKEYVLQYNGRFLVADLKEVSRITDEDPREVMLCLRNNHSEDSELIGSGAKTVFVESENITIIDFPPVGRKRFLELASYPLADSADFDDIKPKPLRDAGNYCASHVDQKKSCAKPIDQLPI